MAIVIMSKHVESLGTRSTVKQAGRIQKKVSTRALVAVYQRIMASSHPLAANRIQSMSKIHLVKRRIFENAPDIIAVSHDDEGVPAQTVLGRHIFTKTDPELSGTLKTGQDVK